MAVSKRLRFEILRRDNHTCRYCGATAPEVKLTVDHVIPEALGGTDDPGNLVAACTDCNSGKSATPPDAPLVAQVSAHAEHFAEAIKQVATQRRTDEIDVKKWFSPVWYRASDGLINAYDINDRLLYRNCPAGVYTDCDQHDPNIWTLRFPDRPKDWVKSVQNFIAAGLERDHIESLVATAMGSRVRRDDKWKYFCGCAWRAIRELHERAAELIRTSEVSR